MIVKNSILWIFILAILGFLTIHIPVVIVPFAVAFVLAYILNPMVMFFKKSLFLPRILGIILSISIFAVAFLLLLILLVPMIYNQIGLLVNKLPVYRDYLDDTLIPLVISNLERLDQQVAQSAKESFTQSVDDLLGMFVSMLNNLWSYTMATINALIMIFLIPVLLFYYMKDWDKISEHFYCLFPKNSQVFVKQIFLDIDKVLSGYIRGQLFVCFMWVVYYYIIFSLIGLDLAFILAILSGLSPLIPIIGPILAVLSTMIVGFFTFGFGPGLFYVIASHLIGAILDGIYVTPKIIGSSIGLSPVWVMFSVFTMGYILGPIGLLIGVPIAGIISVILRYATQSYKESKLYNKKK